MKTLFIDTPITYDGSQLRSLYNYLEHGLLGNSIIAFHGPCNVKNEFMADGEDLLAGAEIRSSNMAHFIIEIFDQSLFSAVWTQRLLASTIQNYIYEKQKNHLRREGDDLYLEDKKLSISIAAPSTRSCLIHFAVNVSNIGTPVKTCSLEDLKIDAKTFSQDILILFRDEFLSIQEATFKVKSL